MVLPMPCNELDLLLWPRDRVPSRSMLALLDPRKPDRANPPTNFWWSLFLTALAWSTCSGFLLDRQSTRNTVLRPALFKPGQWHFQQDNAPVHNSILVTDYLIKMGINTVAHSPYCPDLAVTNVIDTLTQEDSHGVFQKLLESVDRLVGSLVLWLANFCWFNAKMFCFFSRNIISSN